MASQINVDSAIDTLLNPRLHHVVGTTPESLRTSVETAGIEGKKAEAASLSALALFAASVNKKAVIDFYKSRDGETIRNVIVKSFTLNNEVNMTAISVLGHCLYTIDDFDNVKYVQQFRSRMGQKSIWAGDMSAGSMSDQQKKIIQQRKNNISLESAKEFANWYVEYTGLRSAKKARPATGKTTDKGLASGTTKTTRDTSAVAKIPDDLEEYWFDTLNRSNDDFQELVDKRGFENAINKIRRDMARQASGEVPAASTVG